MGGKDPRLSMRAQLDADVARAVRLMPRRLAAGDAASIQGTVKVVLTASGSVASPSAGCRRNRGQAGLRIARGRPARDQVIDQTETASSFISSTSRRRRAPCRRAARSPCQERTAPGARHRHQAASPCAGRMSTWIARWRAPATRSLRRSAQRASGRAELRLRPARAPGRSVVQAGG